MLFERFLIILLVIGLQSGYFDCVEPPRVREYDADVPNIYNGGLKVAEQLSAGNEKMAKFIDSARVELSLDHFNDDSYIQAYKLTHENYQNNEEQLSIDVARENRAHLEQFRVKRQALNTPEPIKFQMSDAKIPDAATLQAIRNKKELRNVRSPYEVVENLPQSSKLNRMGHRPKMVVPRLYNGVQTHRYGLRSDYNRGPKKPQHMSYRKADTPEFGAKLWWNPSELNRYKRLQHRGGHIQISTPTPVVHQTSPPIQHTYFAQQQPQALQQQHYVSAYVPYQEVKSVPQTQQVYDQQEYNQFDTQKYNVQYNQSPQYDEKQSLLQQQFMQTNPYGPVEVHFQNAKSQYNSAPKLDPSLEVLQSLIGQEPKQQLQGLQELLSKEGQYQQQQYQLQQYQQQQLEEQRPQDSTAPIQFHPIDDGQANQLPVAKQPQYQYTVAGSTKQIVPIPISTTTFAPLSSTASVRHTTVTPSTLRYQDLLPSSTPAPFSAVTIESPLNLLPVPVQHGPESQNALIHSFQHPSSTPSPLSHHNEDSLNSLHVHNFEQQVHQQQQAQQAHHEQHYQHQQEVDSNHSAEEGDNHDVSIKTKRFYSSAVHNIVKRSARKRRPQQRRPPPKVEYFYSKNPEYDFYIIPRTKKPPKRSVYRSPVATTPLPHYPPYSIELNEDHAGEVIEEDFPVYGRPNFDRHRYTFSDRPREYFTTTPDPYPIQFENDSNNDESSSDQYEVVYDENEFYHNRQKILKLTEELRKKNREFFENLDKSDDIQPSETKVVQKTVNATGAENLKYENIFSNVAPQITALDGAVEVMVNASEARLKRNYDLETGESVVNFNQLTTENYGNLRIDLGINSTFSDPDGRNYDNSNSSGELDDMNEYFFDENGTLIENFDDLNMAVNESRALFHIMPIDNGTKEFVPAPTNLTDLVSDESRSISDRSSYAYGWDGEDDDDDDYDEEDEYDDDDYEWRPRKAHRKRAHHRRQQYKIVPVTVYKKIPYKRRHKSKGDVNIDNVNIYEKPPRRKIIHHQPVWHYTQVIKKARKPKRWYYSAKPYRPPHKRSHFNKVAWLLQHHHR